MALTTAQIQQAYVTFFSRPADPVGLAYWQNYSGSVADLYATFAQQTEYSAAFSGLTSAQKVNVVYQNLFGRDAEASGLLYWAGQVEAGKITVANLAMAVSAGSQGTDKVTVDSRVSAATSFTAALDTPAEILGYTGATANAAAKTWLSGVTTAANLATAVAAIDTAAAGVVAVGGAAGSTFTLTTGADAFAGTSGNDTFNALASDTAATTDTFNILDTLTGGAGNDVLNITVTGTNNANTLVAANVSGIETVNVRSALTTPATLTTVNATNFSGVTAVNADRATSALKFTNLPSGTTTGISAGSGDVEGAYKSTATVANISAANGATAGAVVVSGTGLTTANITSTGAANTLTSLDVAGATTIAINAASDLDTGTGIATTGAATIAITGSGLVKLASIDADVTKVTQTGAGGLTATVGAVTQTIAAGNGVDTITTNGALTTGSVAAGTGTTDKLIVANAADLASAALGAKYTGFETLQSNVATTSLNTSYVSGITGVVANVATNNAVGFTNMTATQAANAKVLQSNTTGVTFALADSSGSSDTLNLSLASATATTNVDAALTVAGFETVNVSATTGTAGTQSDITFLASGADKLTKMAITGSAEVTIAGANTSKAIAIDASALTGKFTASGDFVSGTAITGSSTAVNTFTVGSNEGVTFIGGAGKDVFNATQAQLTADGTHDNVLNGGAGSDQLNITGNAVTSTDVDYTNVSNMEKLDFASNSSVSLTSGAAFASAFSTGVTITDDTIADGSTGTFALGLYNSGATVTLTTAGDGATTADNVSVTTGSGADTIAITASSWVGHATTNGAISVTTGAGDDSITVSTGTFLANANANAVVITAGTGADTINVTHVNSATASATAGIKFTVAAGDSTVSAYDNITGFKMSDIAGTGGKASDGLDFASVGLTTYAATAPTGYSAAELTVAVSAAGLVTFAGTSAAGLTLAQKISAVQAVVTTNAGDSALFTDGTDSYVFNNNASGDSLVKLVGISAAALITTNDATTDNGIFIQ